MIILSCFIANMEQDIFLDMFFAFFFAVSENLFTFAAIKGSHWRNLPKVLSRGRNGVRHLCAPAS